MHYDKIKSDFLATVAHEVNTPLAIIAASSNDTLDLLEEIPLNLKDIAKNQQVIEKKVKLIDSIILDLMDNVIITNNKIILNRQPLSLYNVVKNVCEAQIKAMNLNNNSILFDLRSDLPVIWADSLRVEQVVANLLTNAVHHTKDGEITISLTRDKNGQTVCVRDNGEGMDEAFAQAALEQYISTKADGWRHGIGLYLCRRIIETHGGKLWIESVKNVGTSVFFTLSEEAYYV
jgi:signal transduction histidine kinase